MYWIIDDILFISVSILHFLLMFRVKFFFFVLCKCIISRREKIFFLDLDCFPPACHERGKLILSVTAPQIFCVLARRQHLRCLICFFFIGYNEKFSKPFVTVKLLAALASQIEHFIWREFCYESLLKNEFFCLILAINFPLSLAASFVSNYFDTNTFC